MSSMAMDVVRGQYVSPYLNGRFTTRIKYTASGKLWPYPCLIFWAAGRHLDRCWECGHFKETHDRFSK